MAEEDALDKAITYVTDSALFGKDSYEGLGRFARLRALLTGDPNEEKAQTAAAELYEFMANEKKGR